MTFTLAQKAYILLSKTNAGIFNQTNLWCLIVWIWFENIWSDFKNVGLSWLYQKLLKRCYIIWGFPFITITLYWPKVLLSISVKEIIAPIMCQSIGYAQSWFWWSRLSFAWSVSYGEDLRSAIMISFFAKPFIIKNSLWWDHINICGV